MNQDRARARALYQKACYGKLELGCSNRAELNWPNVSRVLSKIVPSPASRGRLGRAK